MPYAHADGVNLYYEDTGSGFPIGFVHEFAGDYRSWEPQIRFFARRYRCITFSARGYPPSDVPLDPGAYSQDQATDDVATVMQAYMSVVADDLSRLALACPPTTPQKHIQKNTTTTDIHTAVTASIPSTTASCHLDGLVH